MTSKETPASKERRAIPKDFPSQVLGIQALVVIPTQKKLSVEEQKQQAMAGAIGGHTWTQLQKPGGKKRSYKVAMNAEA